MNIKHLWSNMRNRVADSRGVTLMELILVVAIMTMVFGGIVSLLISMYGSYEQVSGSSQNGQQATMIINQMTQDIRKSVGDDEQKPVRMNEDEDGILITTQKHADEQEQTVEYRNQNGKIVYVTGDGTEIELCQSGLVTVEELEADQHYQLTVMVGSGAGQVRLTTEVARYDWGEFFAK